jgi:hypothetical protein
MEMTQKLEIPIEHAGNYFDFICMWVYPFTFHNIERLKLERFFNALVKAGYKDLMRYSYIARENKMELTLN